MSPYLTVGVDFMLFRKNKVLRGFHTLRAANVSIALALVFTVALCAPVFAQTYNGRFVSNTPMQAGPNASLEEVWMKHGGARLQFDALMGPIQVNTNGRPWRDPAMVNYLPPLYPKKRGMRTPAPTVRESKRPSQPASANKTAPNSSPTPTLAPQPVTTVAPSTVAPAVQTSENASGSGSLGGSGGPYSGSAPTTPDAPQAGTATSQVPSKENQDPFHYH